MRWEEASVLLMNFIACISKDLLVRNFDIKVNLSSSYQANLCELVNNIRLGYMISSIS